MPMITVDDGASINVEVQGDERAPALMLSNSLGTNLHMWDDQAVELAKHFRLIRYDRRGHGRSSVPPGPYSMERFGRDVVAILDKLGVERTNWCGLSMGGMVGQWLGANAPRRVNKLILSNTASYYSDKGPWAERIALVREKGLGALVDANMQRWFTEGFRKSHPQVIERMKAAFTGTDPKGYIASCEAIRDMDFRDSNARIKAPTMVIVGAHDPATPPAQGEAIAKAIPGAKVATIDAAHIANMEQPQVYTKTVLEFLLG
jgi:3-oxoadipate enol-lactonase